MLVKRLTLLESILEKNGVKRNITATINQSLLVASQTGTYEGFHVAPCPINIRPFDVQLAWPNSSVRASMVRVGEADIGVEIGDHDAANGGAGPGPQISRSFATLGGTFYLRLDTGLPPLNDRRVRLAMNYALDRASAIGTVLSKDVLQATQIIVPNIPGHNFELDKRPYPYDPEKAKKLIAEAKAAGVPVGNEILMISYPVSFPNAAELMEAFYTMFKDIGLNVKITSVDPGQYAKWNAYPFPDNRPPTILQALHNNNYGDPSFSVFNKYGCGGTNSMFCDPDIDREIQRVSDLSGEERVAGWQRLFQVFYEDLVPDIQPYHMVGFTEVSKRIRFTPDVTINNEIRVEEISFQ